MDKLGLCLCYMWGKGCEYLLMGFIGAGQATEPTI